MRHVTDEAVVLKVTDHGEGHRIAELLTRERGVLRAFAPGAQRSRRRFGGALEPGTLVRATLKERPGRDLWNLEEATVVRGHAGLRARLEDIALASYFLDLTRALVRDEQPHPGPFALLVDALGRLDAGTLPAWGRAAFELGALSAYGAAPVLGACARCGRPAEGERSRFAPTVGGLLCPACAPHWGPGDVVLSRSARRALEALAGAGGRPEIFERAAHLPSDPELLAEVRPALDRSVEHLLGRRLKSLDFLDSVAT